MSAEGYDLDVEEARDMTAFGLHDFAESRGGIGQILEDGDTATFERMRAIAAPHLTAEDIEVGREMSEVIQKLADDAGVSFDEARVAFFKRLESRHRSRISKGE